MAQHLMGEQMELSWSERFQNMGCAGWVLVVCVAVLGVGFLGIPLGLALIWYLRRDDAGEQKLPFQAHTFGPWLAAAMIIGQPLLIWNGFRGRAEESRSAAEMQKIASESSGKGAERSALFECRFRIKEGLSLAWAADFASFAGPMTPQIWEANHVEKSASVNIDGNKFTTIIRGEMHTLPRFQNYLANCQGSITDGEAKLTNFLIS